MSTETSTVTYDTRAPSGINAEQDSTASVLQCDPAKGAGEDDALFRPRAVAGDGPAVGRAHGPTRRGPPGPLRRLGIVMEPDLADPCEGHYDSSPKRSSAQAVPTATTLIELCAISSLEVGRCQRHQ